MPANTPFNGVRLFRYALLTESALNIGSAIPLLLTPANFLTYLVASPDSITPFACSLTQWFGAVTLGLTAPLLLSVPHVPRAAAGRRMVYTTFAACEAALGAVMALQWFSEDSEIKPQALAAGVGFMGVALAVRGFFLFVRPGWMEGQENVKKVT